MSYGKIIAMARGKREPEDRDRRYNWEQWPYPGHIEPHDRHIEPYDRHIEPYDRRYTPHTRPRPMMEERYDDWDDDREMAFRDRRGRRHYENGRYAPTRNMDGGEEDMRIGFDMGTTHKRPEREMGRASVYENEEGGWDVHGRFNRNGAEEMTKEIAETWTSRMRNEDGSMGPHWSMEQIKQLQQQKKELQDFELPEVFAVINMMYSDYCKVAKKFSVNTMDFYTALAIAWLDDKDSGAGPSKTAKYYMHVVK